MGYLDDTMKFRSFDPLHIPKIKKTDCVFHYCVYLQESVDNRKTSTPKSDFEIIKKNIENFENLITSKIDGHRIDFIISINGHIENQEYIDYFKSIDNTVINKGIYITVFQRQNIGFQWGGFHDVWMRYKDIDCNFYVTMESDVFLTQNYWFDIASDIIKSNDTIGYFGKYQNGHPIDPKTFCNHMPKEIWRTGQNKINLNIRINDTTHSAGGFYFCKKDLLQKMDDAYGCFTHSMGCNWRFDGVVLGEVMFCNKTKQLGYNYADCVFKHFAIYYREKN